MPTRLRVLRDPVRISVAYGNIPAPGLGKLECASQESLRIVYGCLAEAVAVKENIMKLKKIVKDKRRAKMKAEVNKSEAKVIKKEPKGNKKEPKRSQKWAQKGAKNGARNGAQKKAEKEPQNL